MIEQMHSFSTRFAQSIHWNIVEAGAYQALLLAHQLLLFKSVPMEFYGLIGALFSLVYVLSALTDFGFEATLPLIFNNYSWTLATKRAIFLHLMPQTLVLMLLLIITICVPCALPQWHAALSHDLITLLIACALAESLRKHLRAILHCALWNEVTTYTEVIFILGYMLMVWTLYALHGTLTIMHIFSPFLIMSTIHTVTLYYYVHQFFLALPSAPAPRLQPPLASSRLFAYGIQMHHQFFSSNFLIPFIAFSGDLMQASLLKLISSLFYAITGLTRKAFSAATTTLLSHTANLDQTLFATLFNSLTKKLHQSSVAILIIFILYQSLPLGTSHSSHHALIMVLFACLHVAEFCTLTYEKLYIAQKKSLSLFLVMTFFNGLAYGTLWYINQRDSIYLLTLLCSIKIVTSVTLWYGISPAEKNKNDFLAQKTI